MAAEKHTREVITLQVGNYSNFVGAHFWNLQEALLNNSGKSNEINKDILYREGQNIAGERIYKPRAICLDLKTNFSNCKQYVELSDELEAPAWEGTVERYDRGTTKPQKLTDELERLKKKSTKSQYEYHDQTDSTHSLPFEFDTPASQVNSDSFESSIMSWLDYSEVHFHEKSFHRVGQPQNDEGQRLGNFGSGERLFETRKFQDNFEDKLHFFAEECDRLQGFQVFSILHFLYIAIISEFPADFYRPDWPAQCKLAHSLVTEERQNNEKKTNVPVMPWASPRRGVRFSKDWCNKFIIIINFHNEF